jgi:aminopeptidase
MFDDRVYKRGALFLHAIRSTAGDVPFFAMLRAWATDHADGSVTTEEFVDFAAERLGPRLRPLADAWLYERGLPDLPVS